MNKDNTGAILTIDLDAIVYNWHSLKTIVSNNTACGAVVKSDAYGIGGIQVAEALYNAGCNVFFVAYSFEGVAIRKSVGKDAKIFILHGPISDNQTDFSEYSLIPVLNTMEQVKRWLIFSHDNKEKLPCALHFDTGMSRLGFSKFDRIELFGAKQQILKELNITMVMSHLACGADADNPYNHQQLAIFTDIKNSLNKILEYSPKYSLSATAGMFLGNDYHFDLTRPGCALYGFYPSQDMKEVIHLKNPITLKAKILQIQSVTKGQAVGYDSTFRFGNDGIIATAAIGYADGFRRTLNNKGFGYIDDYKVPIVGNVSMDLTTFDVSGVPAAVLKKAKEVEIIGPHISLDELADKEGIITYEVLTDLGHRYYREYIGETLQPKGK